MRVTTWLLMEHITKNVALLIESFLMSDDETHCNHAPLTQQKKNWTSIAIGEHMELIMDTINTIAKGGRLSHILSGFCSTGNIPMIHLAIKARTAYINHNRLAHRINQNSDFDYGLLRAIQDNQVEAGRIMFVHGGSLNQDDALIEYDIEEAVSAGDYDMCLLIKDIGCMNRDLFMKQAAISKNTRILELVDNRSAHEEANNFAYYCMYDCYNEVKGQMESLFAQTNEVRSVVATFGIKYAASSQHGNEIVELLLEHKGDPNAGMPISCTRGYQNTINILIAAGATTCDCAKSIAEHTPDYGKKRKRESEEAASRKFREMCDQDLKALKQAALAP